MKLNNQFTKLASATAFLTLLAATSFAADEKEKATENPRPAQESRSAATTGKDATKPSEGVKETGRPETAPEPAKVNPRPAQESRGGATTGRDATKPAVTPAEEKATQDQLKADKQKEEKAEADKAAKKAEK